MDVAFQNASTNTGLATSSHAIELWGRDGVGWFGQTQLWGRDSYGLYSYGPYSYGLYSYGLCSHGLYSYGLNGSCPHRSNGVGLIAADGPTAAMGDL